MPNELSRSGCRAGRAAARACRSCRRRQRPAAARPAGVCRDRPRRRQPPRHHAADAAIDNALYNAFGQRLVSTIFTQANQYRVVLEVKPEFQARARGALDGIYVGARHRRRQVPLSVARVVERPRRWRSTTSGSSRRRRCRSTWRPGASLGDAVEAIRRRSSATLGLPRSIQTSFQGAALAFQSSLDNTLLLILAAIVTMYIVLGVLYESYIHPITILSTLPSAGVGALLALMLTGTELA